MRRSSSTVRRRRSQPRRHPLDDGIRDALGEQNVRDAGVGLAASVSIAGAGQVALLEQRFGGGVFFLEIPCPRFGGVANGHRLFDALSCRLYPRVGWLERRRGPDQIARCGQVAARQVRVGSGQHLLQFAAPACRFLRQTHLPFRLDILRGASDLAAFDSSRALVERWS